MDSLPDVEVSQIKEDKKQREDENISVSKAKDNDQIHDVNVEYVPKGLSKSC